MKENNTLHTPAPWIMDTTSEGQYGSYYVNGGHARRIALLPLIREDISSGECRANARLISAAPELLACAKGALGYLQALPESHRPDPSWFKPLIEAIEKAEAM